MLESLEYKVDPTTDTLLMQLILFKLETNFRTWFERTFSIKVIPKLDDLLQFLATQAISITSSTTKRYVKKKRGRQGAVNVLDSRCLSVNTPVFSPALIPGTSEPIEISPVVDVISCISDVRPVVQTLLCTAVIQLVSDHLINKFWELDSLPYAKPLTSLEETFEYHFVTTHSRDENGRYTVRLAFHIPPTRLDEQDSYPAASRATLCHFCVDDLLSASVTKKEAIRLASELQEMMKRVGISLCKWVSNDSDVLASISERIEGI
ncbi:DUF1758 domain-containing protein [Trichonephila clavata]|uniref:DUF1758 domain-containing protein n=1 Tax=Trichonephila clavata TaxID=2740835 RepID=A0A8X6HLF4_TRICU|nr:DUF1758 domain-containing protein [Trichonephila clavata]